MAERPQVLGIPPRGEEEQAEDEAAGPDMDGALLTGVACRPATHGPLIVCGRARRAQAPDGFAVAGRDEAPKGTVATKGGRFMAAVATRLTNAPVMTMLPATDLERARDYYESKLGLRVDRDASGELRVHAGKGTEIGIYERGATKADHTTATFEVDDVRATVGELRSRGVVFEEYGGPGPVTKDGIAERGSELAAWFKDSEGNILCVHSAP